MKDHDFSPWEMGVMKFISSLSGFDLALDSSKHL
jgi:hypothetical protein